jgi:hypothetical protein
LDQGQEPDASGDAQGEEGVLMSEAKTEISEKILRLESQIADRMLEHTRRLHLA